MAVEAGSAFLLKIGNGGIPPVFSTVAGLRASQVSIEGELVAVTHKGSGGWRELLGGAGVRAVTLSGSGVFTGASAEVRLRQRALDGALDDFQASFESGETLTGRFVVRKLDYAGDYNGERTYTVTLESSGVVVAA